MEGNKPLYVASVLALLWPGVELYYKTYQISNIFFFFFFNNYSILTNADEHEQIIWLKKKEDERKKKIYFFVRIQITKPVKE